MTAGPAGPSLPAAAAQPASASPDVRTRALREADGALARADAHGSTVAGRLDALAALAAALVTLSGTSAAGVASPPPTPVLPAELQDDLRVAADALQAVVAASPGSDEALAGARADAGVAAASIAPLLERVRLALDGGVALGLTFQGSYSQSKAKEPVYGGHATAMGPAPAPPPTSRSPIASPVVYDVRDVLPTRTWAGGPTKDHILESAGNGVALFDYDNDGLLDVYLVTAPQLTAAREPVAQRNALYRNLGDWRFEDVSARAGVDLATWGSGACVGDVDGDGWLDLYVTAWGTNALYRNRGDGTFEETASRAGVAAGGWSTGCTFFDADGDGDLDLYVVRYVRTSWDDLARARRTLTWRNGPRIMVGPAGLPAEGDLFFENLGDGRFRDATAERGLDGTPSYGFGVVATDYDDDGDVDLFVANDSMPNFLYRNRGDGHFESVGLLAGVAVNAEARAQAGMGVDAGDMDGDGRIDLVLTAFAHDRNSLYRSVDGEAFDDASVASGLAATTFERMGWGVAMLDADLDGRLDLFIANGHIFADVGDYPDLKESFAQRNQLLVHDGRGWRDVSDTAGPGLQVARVSRGLATGDLDNDGDLDVVVSNMDEAPTLLELRERPAAHHWIGVRLTAPAGNRFGIGARVTFDAAGARQVREIRSGGSYLSQSDLRAFAGLGVHDGPVDVEVRLPGGDRWRWTGLAPDTLHVLELRPDRRVEAGGRTP